MPWMNEGDSVAIVDATVKNKWRWAWLDEKNVNKDPHRLWCVKLDKAGVCFCRVCNSEIKYGTNGKKRLIEHGNHPVHLKAMKIVSSCEAAATTSTSSCVPTRVCGIAEKKAKLLAFVSEHALPFSLVPDLLSLCKVMSDNKCKTLSQVHMSDQCATYTLTHGLGAALKKKTREVLKTTFFSINVDEATNNAMNKVVNIIVRYFSEADCEVKTEHFASKIVNQATAENIHAAILNAFSAEEGGCSEKVPLSQMISCMMDNCAVMRGVKGGVEALLRKGNPHLLDIAGDTVHTVASAAKELFKPFQQYVENISSEIYYDIQKSPKAKDMLHEIQLILGSKPLQILRFCPSRFLQMLDVAERLHKLKAALQVYYFSFLTAEEQHQYRAVIDEIQQQHSVTEEGAARIRAIQLQQAKQSRSSTSDCRKDRLLTALFKDSVVFFTTVNLYRGLLPKFQGYVKLFQSEKPVLHLQHEHMFHLAEQILILFMKSEAVPRDRVRNMIKLVEEGRICDRSLQKPDSLLSAGSHSFQAYTTALAGKRSWAQQMAAKLREGYVKCATMLITKLPLQNKAIIRLSSLHPDSIDEDGFITSMVNLAKNLPNVVPIENVGTLQSEALNFQIDKDVSILAAGCGSDDPIDRGFWSKVFKLQTDGSAKFPVLSCLVKALLSIFTGPLVESSFNLMDDYIRADRTRLSVENYEASALVRSHLKSNKCSAITMNVTHEMSYFIRTSKGRYNKYQEEKKHKQLDSLKSKQADAVKVLGSKSQSGKTSKRCLSKVRGRSPKPSAVFASSVPSSTSSGAAAISSHSTVTPAATSASSAADTSTTHSNAQSTPAATSVNSVADGSTHSNAQSTPAATSINSAADASTHSNAQSTPATKKTFPKGGKRAALQASSDIRNFINKRPRLLE